MFQRTFVRKNLLNSDRTPENIPQDSSILPDKEFDEIQVRLRGIYHENKLPHPISQSSVRDSPCEIGYAKGGYDVNVYLINGGAVCLVNNYQGLSLKGDVIQKQIILFHEDSLSLESLCRNLIVRKSIDAIEKS